MTQVISTKCIRAVLMVALAGAVAHGAVLVDANVSTDRKKADTNVQSPQFSTVAANELLLALVAADYQSGQNTTVSSITGAGLTWVRVVTSNGQSGTSEIWRAFSSGQLNSVSVTATLSRRVVSSITIMSFTGVDPSGANGAGAIGAVASGSAATGPPSATLVTTRNNSLVIGVGNDIDNAIGRTPSPGQSLVHQAMPSVGVTFWVQVQNSPTPLSGSSVSISDTYPTTDRFNLAICEILPAATTGTQTWRLSGTISPAAGGSGATVTLSGTAGASATADASGNYSFANLANGGYTVTVAKTGYTFSPSSQSVSVNGANLTGVNFTAQAVVTTWSLSGTISPAAGGSSATVTLSGTAGASTTADASGNYSFANLANGAYTVTAAKTGYTFSPSSQSVTVNGANLTGVNFTAQATVTTWSLSGTISPAAGGSGATVTLSGTAGASTTADASGNYSFANLANGAYTVTAAKTGYTFSPSSQSVTVNGANLTGVNFTAQSPGSGPIAIDANTSVDRSTAGPTLTAPLFSTTSGNELLLAFIATDLSSGSNITVTGVSGGGLTWVLVVRANSQSGTSEIWRAFATVPLTNVSITATLSQSVAASMTVLSFTGTDTSGANGSGAIGAAANHSAPSGAPSVSLTTTRNGSWIFGVGNDFDNAIARTPAAGQTLVHQYLATVGDTYWVQSLSGPTPLAGTAVNLSDTAPSTDRYNLSACEILPAVASGPYVYGISGTITPPTGGSSATVTLTGAASAVTTTDVNGNFTFANLPSGVYSVTPSNPGFTFSPATQTVTLNGGNATGINFTAAPNYTLSGTITPAAIASGAVVTLSGAASGTTTVDSAGAYSFAGLAPGTYTVTPSSPSATFSPASQTVTISAASQSGVTFTATATTNVIFFDDFTGSSLSSAWTVISRHGEYAQSETECNIPQQVSVANGYLNITTAAQNWSCGDFNIDGTVRHAATTWPYITGDIQWSALNFTYGTVEIRAKFPDKATQLWPALWLLGSNCQVTNPKTADVNYSTCPGLSSPAYAEIDMVECDLNNWCQLALSNTNSFPTCGFHVDTNFHVFTMQWTPTLISLAMDGQDTGCSYSSSSWVIPSSPMFLIIQTQTGPAGGTPNNSLLPATFTVDYVKVTQP